MICKNCNQITDDGGKFCRHCGASLENKEETVTAPPVQNDIQEETAPVVKEQASAPLTASFENGGSVQMPEGGNSNKKRCKLCGGNIDKKTKKCESCGKQYFKLKPAVLVAVILAVLLVATNGYFIYQIREKDNKIRVKDNKISEYKTKAQNTQKKLITVQNRLNSIIEQNNDMADQLNFYDYHAAIVPNDGTRMYHKYSCTVYNKSNGFWIYNTEAAQGHGYYPCPYCH